MNNNIIIKGLKQNNLKNISLELEKNKIIVFTGVSGSGKSSIVFDTIAAESQRQMNETYSAWARSRLPKYQKPKVEVINHLNASVIIDQSRIVGNARSTVGTISEMYSTLRVLFSRVGQPEIGPASYFSFNNPNGMCKCCSGIGKIMDLKIEKCIDAEQSWNESMIKLPGYKKDNYYWRIYTESNLFDLDKKYKDYSLEEKNLLLYGSRSKDGVRENKKVEGIKKQFERLCLMKSEEQQRDTTIKKIAQYMEEETCPACHGKRLQPKALEVKVLGYTIDQMCEMELSQLKTVLQQLDEPTAKAIAQPLIESLTNMIDIGLPYLSLNRETTTLSGGEAQRLKIVRYMSSSLTGMTYIFDEPSVGLHPRDVYRMCKLLQSLRDKGNTVLVVEHDKDIIKIADEIVDVGPKAGVNGGKILFQGSYADLLLKDTLTSQMLKQKIEVNANPAMPKQFLPIRDAHIHNLKNVNVDIPLNVLCVVTGVAGSGKSSLIRDVFAKKYQDKVVMIDQSAITATGRSTVCTYLGFFDEIRKVFAQANQTDAAYFSFNSKGACPRCKGRGTITTELVFMDPVTTECEHCGGKRYSQEALRYCYQQKNIVEVLQMNVLEASDFFHDQPKILKALQALKTTGVEYLSLGQPLSTFSGGERQRVKLAKELHKKGNIYILDEPTTGLHGSDIEKIVKLLKEFVKKGNTVVVIEHNVDIMKMADYIIDVGPDGGSAGGQIVFTGTVKQMVESSDSITAQYIRKSLVE